MHTHKSLALIFSLVLLLFAGCGGGEDEFSLPASTGGAGGGGGPAYDPSTATGTITGNILFEGTPPEMSRISTASDNACMAELRVQSVLVTDDGKLQNVIVYVNSGQPAASYPVPAAPIVLDQMNCRYEPHVSTMMANQPILIRNSDDTTHNIHAEPTVNMVFNFAQARQGMESTETFALPEYMPPVHIKCDVHRWMSANVGVFDHPFHTTSGAGGTYSMSVPPGTYEIRTWHEEYGEMTSSVEVADGATVELDFTYSADSAD